jgi:hypothetical protein
MSQYLISIICTSLSYPITVTAKTQHIYYFGALSDQERPPRWKNHPVEEWVLCIAMVPNASTSSVHPRLCALCTYLCVYLLVLLLIFGCLPHHCPFPELGPFTQTFLVSSCYMLHVNMTKRTVVCRDLTRYRVSWGFPLMVLLRVFTCCQLPKLSNLPKGKGYQ